MQEIKSEDLIGAASGCPERRVLGCIARVTMPLPFPDVRRTSPLVPLLLGGLIWTALYAPAAGHGFIKDDFTWIAQSRLDDGEWTKLGQASTGFFRPVISATFALNHALSGLEPFWYGQTNVLLAAACMAAVFYLCRGVRMGAGASAFAALAWGFNFHGVNLAVLWISGRTSLVSTLAVTLAAGAWVRDRRWLALFFATAGMLAKEDAFVAPALLAIWSALEPGGSAPSRVRFALARSWPIWLAAAACLGLSWRSGAFTPLSAPEFYRYQADISVLLVNGLHYLDRSTVASALGLGVLWLLAGRPRVWHATDRRVVVFGALWWLVALLPTVLLPVRSSLYVLLPVVGIVLIAGAVTDAVLRVSDESARRRVAVGLLIALVVLSPVYMLRNRRLVREADLSRAIVGELERLPGEGGVVVLHDDRVDRPFAEHALGGLAREAALLVTHGRLELWISPRPAEIGPEAPEPAPARVVAELSLSNGSVRRLR